jgi:serine/threonine protein kinase
MVKVLDFGISKIRRSLSQMTQDALWLGTPEYMSPEAARRENRALDGRADQWALAVTVYRALTGVFPFAGEPNAILYQVVHESPRPLHELCPRLPKTWSDAIERALAKDREGRFPRIADFAAALLAHRDHPRRSFIGWMSAIAAGAFLAGWGTTELKRPMLKEATNTMEPVMSCPKLSPPMPMPASAPPDEPSNLKESVKKPPPVRPKKLIWRLRPDP